MPRTACSEHRGIVGWKTVGPVHFYDLQERLATTPAKLDLSTGSPLLLPEMQQVLRAGIAELASGDDLALVLSSYDQMDGLDGLRDQVTGLMTELYRRPVTRAEVLAVPGVQAALRYVHRWLAVRGRRALYPIGLEFPGGVDRTATLAPAVGPYTTVLAADGTSRPVLDVSAIEDWAGVGAVILSRPHSPTGHDWGLAELGAPNVVHLFSMSKLGLAGERVGFAVAAPDILRELARLQRSFIIQPPKTGQYLAAYLLRELRSSPEVRDVMVRAYRDRWESCRGLLRELAVPGLRVGRWEGGLFLWLEWDDGPDDRDVAEILLAEGIALLPGTAMVVAAGHPSLRRLRGLRVGLGAPPEAVARAARAAATVLARLRRGNVPDA